MDPVLLSRVQFALTIAFHYLFPPLTIGMGIVLVWLEANYLRIGIGTHGSQFSVRLCLFRYQYPYIYILRRRFYSDTHRRSGELE